jgi:hypothetical protein
MIPSVAQFYAQKSVIEEDHPQTVISVVLNALMNN